METMHSLANDQEVKKPLFTKIKEPVAPKEMCALCGSTEKLAPFRGRHICRDCITMTKRFHEWDRQYD